MLIKIPEPVLLNLFNSNNSQNSTNSGLSATQNFFTPVISITPEFNQNFNQR